MALFGTFVNGLCIIFGSFIGLFFTKIPERFKETVMQGIGLAVILIGLQMALQADVMLIMLLSLLTGAVIGEWLHIEEGLNRFGEWIGNIFKTNSTSDRFPISQGFVTASLIFGIGAMSVIGALDGGIRGDHEILITKGVIDGFVALVLTTTLGIGVIFSVFTVVLYEGAIALLATQIERWIPSDLLDDFILQLTAVGGLLIVAIGCNLLKVTNIRVGNLLPSLVTVAIVFYFYQLF